MHHLLSHTPSHSSVRSSNIRSNITSMSTAHATPALARYMKQQAADRLSVQQQGAALREAEQLARRRAAAEAPLVLHQLEAEARRKIAMAVCTQAGTHQQMQLKANSNLCGPGVLSSSTSAPCSSKKHRSRSAVWPASSGGSSSSSSACQSNGPMHLPQTAQQQRQPGLVSQAGDQSRQSVLVAAGVQACCLQEGQPQIAVGCIQQHRQHAWQEQQPEQQHGRLEEQLQHGDAPLQPVQQQQQHQQQQQPRPPGQPPIAWPPQSVHQQQQQQPKEQRGGVLSSSDGVGTSTSASPRRHSSRDSCRHVAANALLQPLLPQQLCDQPDATDYTAAAAGAAAADCQYSAVHRRPGSPIAQVLSALACHAAAPRVAAAADPLTEPLLGQ